MTYAIVDLPVIAVGSTPDADTQRLYEAVHGLERRNSVALHGHEDLIDSVAAQQANFAAQTDREKWWLSAWDEDRPVGAIKVSLPLRDNTRVAECEVFLDPTDGVDRRAVLRSLWDDMLGRLRTRGRTVVQIWNAHAIPTGDDPRLVPLTGSGQIRRDETAELLVGLGFELEQVERHSAIELARWEETWPELEAQARAAAGEAYESLTWDGPTPTELRDELARLKNRMSVDVPSGDLEIEEETWDAARVQRQDELQASMGNLQLTAVARHRETGRLVAYTQLYSSASVPTAAWQGDTLVHGEHRGHRLGMLVKLANLRLIREQRPQVERIHTWNADENGPMLSINVALGFRPATAEGAWQLRLS